MLVHRILSDAVSANDREDLPISAFRNRKGFFALIAQAFCDAKAKFRYFEISWPGATGDLTCYKQTELYRNFCGGKYPDWAFMVLDEAYSSLNDNHHVTPFSRHQLRKARKNSVDLYLKMKAFNHILSSKCIIFNAIEINGGNVLA